MRREPGRAASREQLIGFHEDGFGIHVAREFRPHEEMIRLCFYELMVARDVPALAQQDAGDVMHESAPVRAFNEQDVPCRVR